jgi:SAM-dependent methyltransferase
MADALGLVAADLPVSAYDLGAGIGRHTLPMLTRLPPGSEVYAVDLLPSALDRLERAAPQGATTLLHTCQADLCDYTFAGPADLVFAFSVIEHLPDLASIRAVLERIRTAMRPGGIVALGIVADRFEIDRRGSRRPALLESGLSTRAACDVLAGTFADFDVAYRHFDRAQVHEQRNKERYTLTSTLVTWLATRRTADSGASVQ